MDIIKSTLVAAALLAGATAAHAEKGVWDRSTHFTIGYISNSSLTNKTTDLYHWNSHAGVSIASGHTYYFPTSEGWLNNTLKVGVDAKWFEMAYTNYKGSNFKLNDLVDLDGINEDNWEDYIPGGYDPDYDYTDEDYEPDIDLGVHQLDINMGVGPMISYMPFANKDNAARFLRLNLYAHFNPGVSLLLTNEDGVKVNTAFIPAFDFGGNVQWKSISLGCEGRWSSAKYKDLASSFDDYADGEDGDTTAKPGKITYRTNSCKLYLRFYF